MGSQSYELALAYRSSTDWVELSDAAEALSRLGFPAPGRAPLMPLEHQVAQKLHAITGDDDRVRDLVDLQIIFSNSKVDLPETRKICLRLFEYRRKQPWPPAVVARAGWEEEYAAVAEGLHVLHRLDEAVERTNALVASIRDA